MNTKTEHGYLVLADISGYTSYLAKVELEHAHEILTELMAVIVDHFKQVLTISKLEGDAVFANVSMTRLPVGEHLLELIENTYLAFRQRREAFRRQTTCTCRACQAIPTLDLKFFIHHGDYIVQDISGIRELVGTDVNLIHRLTKNHITDATGWRAYILFTQKALEHLQLQPEGLHSQIENYEHLGDIPTQSLDIHPRYEALTAYRIVVIPPEEADYRQEFDFVAPLHVTWDWILDIKHRSQAMGANGHWSSIARPGGRNGIGAKNHCAHGKGISEETILDWHPFEYVTSQTMNGKSEYRSMYIFTTLENDTRTHVEVRMKFYQPKPLWLTRIMVKTQFALNDPYLQWFKSIESLIKTTSPAED